jgi:hypothetical protein
MVIYKFFLTVKGSPDRYDYSLDLTSLQEDNPEKIFIPEIRQRMQQTLENKSSCRINPNRLEQIIQVWSEDIREGYRDTYLTLDLPLLGESKLEQLQEKGNQELPTLMSPNLLGIEPTQGMLPPLDMLFK